MIRVAKKKRKEQEQEKNKKRTRKEQEKSKKRARKEQEQEKKVKKRSDYVLTPHTLRAGKRSNTVILLLTRSVSRTSRISRIGAGVTVGGARGAAHSRIARNTI